MKKVVIKNKNQKKYRRTKGVDSAQVLTIGQCALNKHSSSDNQEKVSSKSDSDEELFLHGTDSRVSKMKECYLDTDDDLEALGDEIESKDQVAFENCLKTMENVSPANSAVNEKDNINESKCALVGLNSTKNEFVPVNVLTSIIPELHSILFPKPFDRSGKYFCIWCKRSARKDINNGIFNDIHSLIRHYRSSHKKISVKQYGIQCTHCHSFFLHEERLQQHLENCTELKARDPGYKELSVDCIMRHCNFCRMVFLSAKRYQKHLVKRNCKTSCKFVEIDHPKEFGVFDYMKCKFCLKKFLFEWEFQNHLTPSRNSSKNAQVIGVFKCRNVSAEVFHCNACNQMYSNEVLYLSHLWCDHKVEDFNLKCNRCEKAFMLKSSLDNHTYTMANFTSCIDYDSCRTIPRRTVDPEMNICYIDDESKQALYTCNLCSERFSVRNQWIDHMIRTHEVEPRWKCEDCKMTFDSISSYEDHITKWKCQFCTKDPPVFSQKHKLTVHCLIKHSNLAREKTTSQIHSTIKPVGSFSENDLRSCPFCANTRIIFPNLLNHIRKFHTKMPSEEMEFVCDVCDTSYYDKQTLKRHIDAVHKGKERTECDICHKTFAQKATMFRHRRIHLDIKPFKCGICELKFTQRTGMKAHEARHYNKDGTLKTEEEIKHQVEVIKQQRESMSGNTNSSEKPKKPKQRKKISNDSSKMLSDSKCSQQKANQNVELSKTEQKIVPSRKSRKRKRHTCENCGEDFMSRTKYDSHVCEEPSEDSSSSKEEISNSEENENNAKNQIVSEYEFKCDKCYKDFASERRYKTHRCQSNYRNSSQY